MNDETPTTPAEPPSEQPSLDVAARLYHQAFAKFRSRALWNIRSFDTPTPQQMLAITRQLRIEGNLDARRLAEQIEELVHAHLRSAV